MQHGTTVSTNPLLSQANKLIEDDRYEQAAQQLITFLRTNPNHAGAHASLGFAALRLGALMQAEQFLRRAIALGAREWEIRKNLAQVLSQQARPGLALPAVEQLLEEREDRGLRGILANLHERLGHHELASDAYARLAQDDEADQMAWVAYGHSLRAAGQVDEAVAAYRRALSDYPDFGEAWWGLASIRRKVFSDEDIDAMREALEIAIDERNIAPLHFSLAKALHDRKQHTEAFEHYAKGNRVRAESLRYDAGELSDEIDESIRIVTPEYIRTLPNDPIDETRPVFIVSLPRSGSTLLEQMLGSHPEIEPVGELPYIPSILRSFMELATRNGKVTVPQAIASIPDQMAKAMGQDYLRRIALHRTTGKTTVIDKLPHNWSNVLFIRRILPNALFLDIRRPAMDCCWSNFTQFFTSMHSSSFSQRDIARAYVDYVRYMDHLESVAPGMVHHIDYAQMLDDPRAVLEQALDYLGFEWDDRVLEFHKLDRVVRTPSSEQVRRPLNRDGMEVWRPYAEWLGPMREELGSLAEA